MDSSYIYSAMRFHSTHTSALLCSRPWHSPTAAAAPTLSNQAAIYTCLLYLNGQFVTSCFIKGGHKHDRPQPGRHHTALNVKPELRQLLKGTGNPSPTLLLARPRRYRRSRAFARRSSIAADNCGTPLLEGVAFDYQWIQTTVGEWIFCSYCFMSSSDLRSTQRRRDEQHTRQQPGPTRPARKTCGPQTEGHTHLARARSIGRVNRERQRASSLYDLFAMRWRELQKRQEHEAQMSGTHSTRSHSTRKNLRCSFSDPLRQQEG